MSPWPIILGAGVVSFLFRFVLVANMDRIHLPASVERASAHVAPAAFAAVAAGMLIGPVDDGVGSAMPLWFAAAITVVMARKRSGPAAVGAGLVAFWVAQAVATQGWA